MNPCHLKLTAAVFSERDGDNRMLKYFENLITLCQYFCSDKLHILLFKRGKNILQH